jgi:AcrR family transcriptional regulator
MGRRQPDARRRLQDAALELFELNGYASTTAAAIGQHAGVTERTFFRHFPDKRDVLVGDQQRLQQLLTETADAQPADADALTVALAGLEAVAGQLEHQRDRQRRRARVVAVTPELRERDLTKMAAWTSALAGSLRRRGTPEPSAQLAAAVAVITFIGAYQQWNREPATQLCTLLHDQVERLHQLHRLGPGDARPPNVSENAT